MASDEELMTQAGEGDMDAFEELVLRHQRTALSVAYRFLGDSDLAEDVAQEAFLKILAAAGRYRPTARFGTYLYNVVWHLCVDLYRKKRAEPLEAPSRHAHDGPGPVQSALADERAALVRRAVQELPPRQRMALVLKHFEKQSYEQIARALQCSSRAVDSLLIRAKRKLEEQLRDLI